MAVTHPRRMTADEFLATPEDNTKTQLIDGVLVEVLLSLRHQRISGEIAYRLLDWLEAHPGPGMACIGCNFRMDDSNVFIPDVWFMTLKPEDFLWHDGPPDLVIEVRSPETWQFDIGRKKDAYLAGGAEVWLVDTAVDEVVVHRGDETRPFARGDTLTTPVIPGFEIDVTTLFDR